MHIETVFKKMCEIRYFEQGLISAFKRDLISVPVYLSTGQEAVAATISEEYPDGMLFPQHRGHSWYLAYGGDPVKLRDEILSKESGCCGGKGGSSDIQSDHMVAHHGFIGENVSIATGYALGSNKLTIPVFGDGGAEEDYVLASLGFASTHKLPILFVCEDNNLAILTKIGVRRHWKTVEVAKAFGLGAVDVEDDPEAIHKALYTIELPFYINIQTCRHYWHVGVGMDATPEQDRLAIMRKTLEAAVKIEKEAEDKMREIWKI